MKHQLKNLRSSVNQVLKLIDRIELIVEAINGYSGFLVGVEETLEQITDDNKTHIIATTKDQYDYFYGGKIPVEWLAMPSLEFDKFIEAKKEEHRIKREKETKEAMELEARRVKDRELAMLEKLQKKYSQENKP